MNHGSLFSGGGGFDLAAEAVGWRNVFHCENDTFCQTILKHYWPLADSHGDIKEFHAEKYAGKIDVLSGGFPCQPFSCAAGSEKAQQMTVISGRKCLELLKLSPRVGSWQKTFTASLIGMTGWYSERSNLIWKLKVTKSQHLYCQLQVSTPRTKDIGFGSSDADVTQLYGTLEQEKGLNNYIRQNWKKLVPTPTTMDATQATAKMKSTQVKPGSMHNVTLCRLVSLLPTPVASDSRGGKSPMKLSQTKGKPYRSLANLLNWEAGTTGQLNPRFVAEMMGFPPNWTELPFKSGEPSQ